MSRPTPTERANNFPIPLTGTGRIVDRVFRERLAAQFAEVEADARREAIRECIAFIMSPELHQRHGGRATASEMADELRRKLAEPGEGK